MDLSMSTIMSTISDRRGSRRNAKHAKHVDGENDRLRAELRLVTSQLEHEREHEQGVFEALNRASERKTEVTGKPRRGLLRLILVGGVAYIFGTKKAGHESSERIRARLSSMEHGGTVAPDDVDTSSPGMGPRPNPLTERGIRPRGYERPFASSTRRSA